jgi:hypothetical protein
MVDAGNACAAYHDEHVRNLRSKRVQVDEIWSFTYAKQKNVRMAKPRRLALVTVGLGPLLMPTPSS